MLQNYIKSYATELYKKLCYKATQRTIQQNYIKIYATKLHRELYNEAM